MMLLGMAVRALSCNPISPAVIDEQTLRFWNVTLKDTFHPLFPFSIIAWREVLYVLQNCVEWTVTAY